MRVNRSIGAILAAAWLTVCTGLLGAPVEAGVFGPLMAPNNLADVSSKPQARSNLSLPSYTATVSTLAQLTGTLDPVVQVQQSGRAGVFAWNSSNEASNVTADPQECIYVPPASDATGASGAYVRQFVGGISQYWCGAVNSGSTDSWAALQAAANLSASIGVPLQFQPGTHKISQTLTILGSGDLSLATINVPATTVSPGIVVGATGAETLYLDLSLPRLIDTDKPGTGWSGVVGSTGVEMINVDDSVIRSTEIRGFGGDTSSGLSGGMVLTAVGFLSAYNNIYEGDLLSNKINLRIKQGDTSSAVNENNFYGGRYDFGSGEGTDVAGTRDISIEESDSPNSNGPPNHNVWYKPSVEGDTPEFHIWVQGNFNDFFEPRYETSAEAPKVNIFSRTVQQSTYNTFLSGYNTDSVVFTTSGSATKYNDLIAGDGSVIEASSAQTVGRPTLTMANDNGTTIATPEIQCFSGNTDSLITTTYANTDWVCRLFGTGFAGKLSTDTTQRVEMNWASNGLVRLGDGTSGNRATLQYNSPGISIDDTFHGNTDNTRPLGTSSLRWSNDFSTQLRPGAGAVIWTSGSGSPNSAVTAPVGSLYTDTSGSSGTTLYVKETGSGNTGWVAK